MSISKVDKITISSKKTEYYSDFLMNLDTNPVSGELSRFTNERAVIRSIRNLLLTNRGERPFDSTIGSDVNKLLFEFGDDVTTDLIRSAVTNTIQQHERRAIVKQVEILISEDQDLYTLTITLSLVSSPADVFSFSTVLKRVR